MKVAGVECKFSEPYGRTHTGLAPRYLGLDDRWRSFPRLHEIARDISPDDERYRHLHAAQVIKHILGLTRAHPPEHFCLLYLWYDAPGEEALRHRAEVQEFSDAAEADGIDFRSRTYQEVILSLTGVRDGHREYVDYLAERCL